MDTFPPESFGQRLGALRVQRGWTQADLAARIAVSRVAVSHFEMGLAVPSERTVVLLAGLFRLTPIDLVTGTDYPPAKRDRLPASGPIYTEIEHQLALLERDLGWLNRLGAAERQRAAAALASEWVARLDQLHSIFYAPNDRTALRAAATRLQRALSLALEAETPSPRG